LVGKTIDYPDEIGPHPDFSDIGDDENEFHYIVSVFLDIKGSTKLATKLSLEEVRFIKNGTMVTAIDIFQAFDGHIHRLQGDAVFAFFGRKGIKKSQAIVDSLNATTCLQIFFQNTLAPMFEKIGLPKIKIRVGVDFGDDKDVMWSKYGIKNTCEITTTSLHTDLAAKLQNRAPSMGIMVGDNIVSYLDLPEEFISKKTYIESGERKNDDYILKTADYSYRMWKFDWDKYYTKFILFPNRETDSLYKANKDFSFKCFHDNGEDNENYSYEYKPNCGVLSKGVNLKFVIELPYMIKYDTIIWTVNNRGKEASNSKDSLNFEMNNYRGKKYCHQATAYTGHHYMNCKVKFQNRTIVNEYFGVFINDKC
jgi:class 3 adenylate cyclase